MIRRDPLGSVGDEGHKPERRRGRSSSGRAERAPPSCKVQGPMIVGRSAREVYLSKLLGRVAHAAVSAFALVATRMDDSIMIKSSLLNRQQAAEYLNLPKAMLDADTSRHSLNVPMIRCGRYVRYRIEDLEAWLQAHRVEASK